MTTPVGATGDRKSKQYKRDSYSRQREEYSSEAAAAAQEAKPRSGFMDFFFQFASVENSAVEQQQQFASNLICVEGAAVYRFGCVEKLIF